MIEKHGKDWGTTRRIHRGPVTELHHISARKGGYSSEHRHMKFNLFYVLSGKLKVVIFREEGRPPDATVLGPEEATTVPPGVWHKFIALEDTECIELYYTLLQEPDIERRTAGGME